MKEFTKMIDMFILSGGIGFISYFILARKGTLTIRKENKEDKPLFILFFSIINMAIYQFLLSMSPILKNLIHKYSNMLFLDSIYFFRALSIILTLIISILLSLYVYPKIAGITSEEINKTRVIGEGKTPVNPYSPRTMVLDKNIEIEVFIFSLGMNNGKRHYISNGFISNWSDNIDERKQIALHPKINGYKTKIFTEEEVLEIINDENIPDNSTKIYIDKDLDMIFYMIYH